MESEKSGFVNKMSEIWRKIQIKFLIQPILNTFLNLNSVFIATLVVFCHSLPYIETTSFKLEQNWLSPARANSADNSNQVCLCSVKD